MCLSGRLGVVQPDDIVAKVAAHLQAEHNVKTISNTLANFVKANVHTKS